MDMIVECDCGWTFRGPEDDLVVAIIRHAHQAHSIELTREQALAVARPADRG